MSLEFEGFVVNQEKFKQFLEDKGADLDCSIKTSITEAIVTIQYNLPEFKRYLNLPDNFRSKDVKELVENYCEIMLTDEQSLSDMTARMERTDVAPDVFLKHMKIGGGSKRRRRHRKKSRKTKKRKSNRRKKTRN